MIVEISAIVAPQCVDEDEGAQSAQEEETDAADKHMLLDNQCWLSARVKRDTTTAKAAWRAMSSMGASLSPADAVVVLLPLGLVHRDVPGAGETARADEGQLRVSTLSAGPEEGDPEAVPGPHAILEALDTVETHMTLHENLRLDQVAGHRGR